MTLSDLKALFRRNIKVVAGGPAVGTAGSNRAAGVLDALDKLAEFAAGSSTPTPTAYQLDQVTYFASPALQAIAVAKLVWLHPDRAPTAFAGSFNGAALTTTNRPLDGSVLAYQDAQNNPIPVSVSQPGPYIEVALADTVTMLAADPPVVRWAFYAITGDWNASGTDTTVYVPGLTDRRWVSTGWVVDGNGVTQSVTVDVGAGTYSRTVDPLALLYSGGSPAVGYNDAALALNGVDGRILRFNYAEIALSGPAMPGAGLVQGRGSILSLSNFGLALSETTLDDLRLAADATDKLTVAGQCEWSVRNTSSDFAGTVTFVADSSLLLDGPNLSLATIVLTSGTATIYLYGLTPDLPPVPAGIKVIDKRYKLIGTGGGSSTLLTGTYTVQPADVTSPASDLVISVPGAIGFGDIAVAPPGGRKDDLTPVVPGVAGGDYTTGSQEFTILASLNPPLQADYVIYWTYVTGNVQAGGVTAAQLEEVRATVRLATARSQSATLELVDAGCLVPCTASLVLTIPADVFAVGTVIEAEAYGAFIIAVAPGAGVTIVQSERQTDGRNGSSLRLVQRGVNEWSVKGGV